MLEEAGREVSRPGVWVRLAPVLAGPPVTRWIHIALREHPPLGALGNVIEPTQIEQAHSRLTRRIRSERHHDIFDHCFRRSRIVCSPRAAGGNAGPRLGVDGDLRRGSSVRDGTALVTRRVCPFAS